MHTIAELYLEQIYSQSTVSLHIIVEKKKKMHLEII